MPTVDRTIHFYRADTGADAAGRPVPLDVSAVFSAVESLPFAPHRSGGRYVALPDGDDLCAWVDGNARPQRLRFARLRRSSLPHAELAGNLSPIGIAKGGALYEAVHMLFLPNNVVGVEFNFYGPRPTRLPEYLRTVLKGSRLPTPFVLEQLLRRDVAEQLEQQSGLRLLDLRVRPSYASVVAQADQSLGAALESARAAGTADVVGVVLQAEPRRRSARLGSPLLEGVRRLARRGDLREGATRFQIKAIGPSGRVEPLDLLKDQLVTVKRVTRLNRDSRAVDSDSAYSAVQAAYDEMQERLFLDHAPGIS